MPNVRIVANPRVRRYEPSDSVAWTLPIDDTTTRIYTLYRAPVGERVERMRWNGKTWDELTPAEHQRYPNDYEAQVGQGAITLHSEVVKKCGFRLRRAGQHRDSAYTRVAASPFLHRLSEERLAAADRGVVMFRRKLRDQIETVRRGGDPVGVVFDPARALVHVEAGNFLLAPAAGAETAAPVGPAGG